MGSQASLPREGEGGSRRWSSLPQSRDQRAEPRPTSRSGPGHHLLPPAAGPGQPLLTSISKRRRWCRGEGSQGCCLRVCACVCEFWWKEETPPVIFSHPPYCSGHLRPGASHRSCFFQVRRQSTVFQKATAIPVETLAMQQGLGVTVHRRLRVLLPVSLVRFV